MLNCILNLFYMIISVVIGMLFGWLIANVQQHKQQLIQKTEKINLEQKLQVSCQALVDEQSAKCKVEFALRNSEREQFEQYGQLIAIKERLISLIHFREECKKLNQELRIQREINVNQEVKLRELTVRLKETCLAEKEKQHLLINSEQRLLMQFENLANRIFENNGRKVDEQNRQSLDRLLIPLREQLDSFSRQIQDSFSQEAREHYVLNNEIRNLQQLNKQISQEAINLTRALKGNNKTQGVWGEVILSRILEASGLREGHEFEIQTSISQPDGRRLQPDVLIRLPQGRDVIIDAKMSLLAYERYFNSENEVDRQLALNEHIHSLRSNIKLLGSKDYQKLKGLQSLDYILMFIPIEPAFIIAISQQPELINEALTNNIMLVSPTTLLVALRTINNLWQYEYQNHNAQRIAERASRLYDKLRLFVDDINSIGQNLDKAQANYQSAKNKLLSGRGNIISQVEEFRTLGVKIKRPITSVSNSNKMFVNQPNDDKITSM